MTRIVGYVLIALLFCNCKNEKAKMKKILLKKSVTCYYEAESHLPGFRYLDCNTCATRLGRPKLSSSSTTGCDFGGSIGIQ